MHSASPQRWIPVLVTQSHGLYEVADLRNNRSLACTKSWSTMGYAEIAYFGKCSVCIRKQKKFFFHIVKIRLRSLPRRQTSQTYFFIMSHYEMNVNNCKSNFVHLHNEDVQAARYLMKDRTYDCRRIHVWCLWSAFEEKEERNPAITVLLFGNFCDHEAPRTHSLSLLENALRFRHYLQVH